MGFAQPLAGVGKENIREDVLLYVRSLVSIAGGFTVETPADPHKIKNPKK